MGGDVARMIARVVLNERAYGEDFNVVTAEHHSWREIAEIYKNNIGLQIQEVSLDDYCSICSPKQVMYDRMFSRVMDNKKILSITGLSQASFKSLSNGLAEELRVNRRELERLPPDIARNAKMDAMCGLVCIPDGDVRTRIAYLRIRFPVLDAVVRLAMLPKRIVSRI